MGGRVRGESTYSLHCRFQTLRAPGGTEGGEAPPSGLSLPESQAEQVKEAKALKKPAEVSLRLSGKPDWACPRDEEGLRTPVPRSPPSPASGADSARFVRGKAGAQIPGSGEGEWVCVRVGC